MKIDLRTIKSIDELHSVFADKLNLPEWYGRNWNAFWDAITGMVETPVNVEFINWLDFQIAFPEDSKILAGIVEDYNIENGADLFKIT